MEELIGDSSIFNGKGRVSNLFESQPFELHFTITKHFWLVSAKRKIRLDHMKLPTRQYYPSVYIREHKKETTYAARIRLTSWGQHSTQWSISSNKIRNEQIDARLWGKLHNAWRALLQEKKRAPLPSSKKKKRPLESWNAVKKNLPFHQGVGGKGKKQRKFLLVGGYHHRMLKK